MLHIDTRYRWQLRVSTISLNLYKDSYKNPFRSSNELIQSTCTPTCIRPLDGYTIPQGAQNASIASLELDTETLLLNSVFNLLSLGAPWVALEA